MSLKSQNRSQNIDWLIWKNRIRRLVPLQRYVLAVAVSAMSSFVPMTVSGGELGGLGGSAGMDKIAVGSKTLVVLGASYAGGWDPKQPVAGYRIVNKGVSGQQSFEMLARFEGEVSGVKPDAVIIWGFINDVFRSDRAQIDETLRRTRESTLAMVELARKSGISPILATEVTIRTKAGWVEALESMIGRILGKSSYQDYINGHVIETNRWIKETAAREGILLLDFEKVLADQSGLRRKEFALPDGSHISVQGYEALTQYAKNQLQAVPGIR
ncbi:MAG: GDSL-type esterase/lipase family protein [Nitrospirota bacterium]|nr:GDSL-type esterase/lipase family protein [Nitrospirota bacterium]